MNAVTGQGSVPELARAMEPVARELLGEPNLGLSSRMELRFGSRGSLAVDLVKSAWHDHEAGEGGGVLDLVMRQRRADKPAALDWLRERGYLPSRETKPTDGFNIVATYDYRDAEGALLFQVCRLDPKSFRQRCPDGAGGWRWTMAAVRRVLYRLTETVAAVAAGRVIYVVEGEKSADVLARIGLDATCSPGGAGKWRETYSETLRSADLVLLPDNDTPGRDHAVSVARALNGIARRIRILHLPNLSPKGDVADWIEAGGTAEALAKLADGAPDAAAVVPGPDPLPAVGLADTALPLIEVRAGELHLNATAAEQAIITSGVPIYQRGPDLVRPVTRELPATRGRVTISAGLAPVTAPALLDVLSAAARWERYDGRTGGLVRTNPPKLIADVVLSRAGTWRVPVVAGIITTPTMRPDGSILAAPGYDPTTQLYHAADPAITLSRRLANPTRKDALAALALLDELLAEFPFTTLAARAVALAALLTPVVRGAMSVVPLIAVRAHTAGTGKSYLLDTAATIATGRPCPVISVAPGDDAETEKRLAGLLLSGAPLLSIDNVNGELGGDLLCQAVERPFVRLRPLGRSDIIELESRATIAATGNNLRVRGDMVRRTIVCDLDAGVERPELRRFAADPVRRVLADRGRFVSAALVIVRAYILAGRPNLPPPLASFEDWSGTVRGALLWLECADPCETMEAARDDDPELAALREAMTAWHAAFGAAGVNVGRVISSAAETERHPGLHDALTAVAPGRIGIDRRKLGRWLLAREGRIAGGKCFRRDGTTDGAIRWTLAPTRADGGRG